MKNIILYNYNLYVDKFDYICDNYVSFYIDYSKYYFIKLNFSKDILEDINTILNSYDNQYHRIIKNRFDSIVTNYDDLYYVLLMLHGAGNLAIDIDEIVKNLSFVKLNNSNLNFSNWGVLWSKKVDYLEYQISELSLSHSIILDSFSYYVGLTENAIEYFNMLDVTNVRLSVSHRRVYYPNTSLNYNNPLNICVDYCVRDIAEYLKTKFFSGEDIYKDLYCLVNKNFLSNEEYNLLYVRLLYPSYYFDAVLKILEGSECDDYLIKYVDMSVRYEKFLKDAFEVISKKANLFRIDWILNGK